MTPALPQENAKLTGTSREATPENTKLTCSTGRFSNVEQQTGRLPNCYHSEYDTDYNPSEDDDQSEDGWIEWEYPPQGVNELPHRSDFATSQGADEFFRKKREEYFSQEKPEYYTEEQWKCAVDDYHQSMEHERIMKKINKELSQRSRNPKPIEEPPIQKQPLQIRIRLVDYSDTESEDEDAESPDSDLSLNVFKCEANEQQDCEMSPADSESILARRGQTNQSKEMEIQPEFVLKLNTFEESESEDDHCEHELRQEETKSVSCEDVNIEELSTA